MAKEKPKCQSYYVLEKNKTLQTYAAELKDSTFMFT